MPWRPTDGMAAYPRSPYPVEKGVLLSPMQPTENLDSENGRSRLGGQFGLGNTARNRRRGTASKAQKKSYLTAFPRREACMRRQIISMAMLVALVLLGSFTADAKKK